MPQRESEDQGERALRPELAHERLATAAEKTAERERHHDRVVELAGDGNEVRHEIERQHEVARQGERRRRGTRGSRTSLPTSTMQSGISVTNARASSRRPATTSSATKSA